jgi:hypothetical protein
MIITAPYLPKSVCSYATRLAIEALNNTLSDAVPGGIPL